jgi:hypothetical protein
MDRKYSDYGSSFLLRTNERSSENNNRSSVKGRNGVN